MILKNRYTYIFIFIYSFLVSNESQDDLFYNYYILNGSPSSIEFDNILENDYEYNLIHKLETDGIASGISSDYENFLETYYHQYKKENIQFINALV